MTISPDTPSNPRPDTGPQSNRSNINERDFEQRPEETSSRSSGEKIAWIVFLIFLGLVGVYVVATFFSISLYSIFDDNSPESIEQQEAPADRIAPPTSAEKTKEK